nr:odorant receptor 9 [Conogethes punctiferalis]
MKIIKNAQLVNNKRENIDITPPRDQLMYKILANVLELYGLASMKLWNIPPYHVYLNKFYAINSLLIYTSPLCILSQLLYLYVHFNDMSFYTLGVMFSVLPIGITVLIKIASTRTNAYKKIMVNFMNKIHVHNQHLEEPDNEFIKSVVKQTENFTHLATYFLAFCLLTDWTAWTAIPVIDYLKNKELIERKEKKLETCLYLYTPFDYSYDVGNWLIVHTFGSYLNFGGITIIIIFDTLCFIFVFNLVSHMKILQHKMERICKIDEMTNEDMRKKLIEIIEYHAQIINYFDDIQAAFGLNITAVYAQNLFVDSLLLYQIMVGVNGEKTHVIIFGLMFVAYMGGLTFMSFVLEEIRRQSETFSDLIYSLQWEDMSKSNQTTVIMILAKMQPPLTFTGAGGLQTGVRPLVSIIKSTFSYYVMLNNRTATR